MWKRILIFLIIFLVVESLVILVIVAAPYFGSLFRLPIVPQNQYLPELNIATSSLESLVKERQGPEIIQVPPVPADDKPFTPKLQPAVKLQMSKITQPPMSAIPTVKEVSSKSLIELINGSIVQLYCGNMNSDKTELSGISRGTGIIINSGGIILTNRHIIYDEIFKKPKSDCFILKSPFPNLSGQKAKIYYFAKIENWPQTEKFSKDFSSDKYYNDFALLKISGKTTAENSKIGTMLGFDYAGIDDYKIVESGGLFNYLSIDWDYQPRVKDNLISVGYGTDASHEARQITSSAGTVSGGIQVLAASGVEVLVVEGNATIGFSGGALIHPQSKGLLGLVSWVSAGAEEGKFTVAIFRDFLGLLMKDEFGIDFRQLITE